MSLARDPRSRRFQRRRLETLVGAWRSLVAHLHGVQGVPSSNLGAPTIKNDRYEIECVRPGVHFRFRAFSVAAMARVSAAQRCKHRAERPPRSAHEALHGGSESYPFLQRDPSCCACPVRPNLVALLVRGRRHHQTSPRRVRGGRADLCRSRPGSGFELREG